MMGTSIRKENPQSTIRNLQLKISAKTEYACIAVLELAVRYESREPVRIREIADVHSIPPRFLVQILLQLKGADLVASTRGAAGGYRLRRPPDEITLGEVMSVIEGDRTPESNLRVESPTSHILMQSWREAATAQTELLVAVTFADLAAQTAGESEAMYYI